MTAQKGSLFLLKVGDGGGSEIFTTVAGLQVTSLTLNNQAVENNNASSGSWRSFMAGAGIRSINISGSGLFTDDTSEESVRSNAFANSINNYQLSFANGDVLQGPFQIRSYGRAGNNDNPESVSLTLESAGEVSFAP